MCGLLGREDQLWFGGYGFRGVVSRADIAGEFSDIADEQIAVGRSAWTAVVPVNMVNIQIDNVGDDRFSPGVGCCAAMAYRERSELMGSDSDSSEDCGCRPPGDVDFDDLREYEAECDWYFTEGDEGLWRADGLQEDRNRVYSKDAYNTIMAPVALSSEEGMTDPRLYSTAGLPDGHGEELLAPRVVPAVFGTTMRTAVGVDRGMLVFTSNGYDLIYETVPQMELLTLEGASGVHPDSMVVQLEETAAIWDNRDTSGPASPFISVVRSDGFARTYDCGLNSPDFLDTGDPTPSRPVLRLRRCLRVLDFASDIDPGPDLLGRDVVSASNEQSGALALPGELLPLRSWRATGSHLFGLPDSNRLVVRESPGLTVREECGYICAVIGDARSFRSELVTESYRMSVLNLY